MEFKNIITEQCGAVWSVYKTKIDGDRSFWLQKSNQVYSVAKPNLVGFYASSWIDAANKLNN